MVMEYAQWKEILSAVNDRQDLNKDNVIDAIKGALLYIPKVKGASPHKGTSPHEVYSNERIESQEYSKWEKTNFDINHLFEAQRFTEPKCDQLTLSHLVADFNFINVANALLGIEKINVDAANDKGYTPLYLATYFGHEKMENILIESGANPSSRYNNGNTPKNSAKGNTKKLLKEAEEKQLDKLNGEKNNLTQGKDDNKGTTQTEPTSAVVIAGGATAVSDTAKGTILPLKETGKKQSTLAGVIAGGATALLGIAVAVALFATGTVAVELIPIVIAVAAIAAAALAVGGITYMMLKSSTEIDEVEKEQGITGDERKA